MAFPGPRPVRSSSSKSLRTSLTSFPRPFCSFHVFSLCNPPTPLDHATARPRSVYPDLLLLTGSCRFNLGYSGSCRRPRHSSTGGLGNSSRLASLATASRMSHRASSTCPTSNSSSIRRGVAKSEVTRSTGTGKWSKAKRLDGSVEITASNQPNFPVTVAYGSDIECRRILLSLKVVWSNSRVR